MLCNDHLLGFQELHLVSLVSSELTKIKPRKARFRKSFVPASWESESVYGDPKVIIAIRLGATPSSISMGDWRHGLLQDRILFKT
jgi:hypothetical protein